MVNWRRITQFLVLTFILNLLVAGLMYYFRAGKKEFTPVLMLFGVIYMTIPMLVTFFLVPVLYREPLSHYGMRWVWNRWLFIGWLLPIILVFATWGVTLILGYGTLDFTGIAYLDRIRTYAGDEVYHRGLAQLNKMPIPVILLSFIQGLLAGPTINAVFAFGEEMGWRGFLQKELAPLGFWRSSLLISIIWGIWHAPLIIQGHNYPQHPLIGTGLMVLVCIGLGTIISYVRVKSRTVYTAAILHGTFNAITPLAMVAVSGGNDITVGITGISGIIVLLTLAGYLYFTDLRNPADQKIELNDSDTVPTEIPLPVNT